MWVHVNCEPYRMPFNSTLARRHVTSTLRHTETAGVNAFDQQIEFNSNIARDKYCAQRQKSRARSRTRSQQVRFVCALCGIGGLVAGSIVKMCNWQLRMHAVIVYDVTCNTNRQNERNKNLIVCGRSA